ncbi:hypothetical protein O3Q51_08695 [Cryomorphaceae bacterium 1068]|nr:hypothetical protein [Cryomorphaceae bacterium 1068]
MKASALFKVSAVLWIIWGLVHILAGVMTMKGVLTGNISASLTGIADAVDPDLLKMDYHDAAGAVIGQHGFNLLWIGIITFVSALHVWKGKKNAIFLAALVGGLADLGYFLFLDLGGFVNFVPGTIMTLISASAIVLSLYGNYTKSP